MLLAMLLVLTHAAAPKAVADTTPARHFVYHTYLRERFQSFGVAGELRFTIANGYVNGTYRPDTGGGVYPVRGGEQGDHIWFDISRLNVHVEGTMHADGTIAAMGTPLGQGAQQYVFTASPLPSASP
ncbi:MAG TPA: hypothetical protein VMD47_00675 [Candidatus Acidoferrales bacterium]|nr:hypothetical protein [Candidatus Acidoferrales bacterium]